MEEKDSKKIDADFFEEINGFIKKFGIEDFLNKISLENINIEKIQKILLAKEQLNGFQESLKYSIRET